MKTILLSGAISMIIALLGTRPTISVLRKRKLGQQVRTGENAPAHQSKSGTPTMGGIVIIIASLIGYTLGHWLTGDPMTASGLLVLFLMPGLGFVGFLDDFIKLFMRRSLGLRSGAKLLGQATVGIIFAVLAIRFPDGYGLTPASERLSFNSDFGPSLGIAAFVVWVLLMVTGFSNGVNLTDGNDLGTVITGSTTSQLLITGLTGANDGHYTCVLTAGNGGITVSKQAALAVGSVSSPGTLFNLSARANVGTGANILIGGFYIVGDTSRTVLIQAVGPGLAGIVPGYLTQTSLQLYQGSQMLYANTGWNSGGDGAVLQAAATDAYANTNLAAGDSAIVATLAPGGYTAQLSGVNGATGVATVGIYQVP